MSIVPPRTAAQEQPDADRRIVMQPAIGALQKTPGLSGTLARLRDERSARGSSGRVTSRTADGLSDDLRGAIAARSLRIDARGSVQVFVETYGDVAAAASALAAAGLSIERVDGERSIVQGRVPIEALDAIASLPGVSGVREPDYPILNVGSVTTEGDAILQAPALRTAFGVDGAGVRIGVISDGLEGLASAQATGDIGAVNTTACDVIASAPAGEPGNPTDAGAGAEGTALLEIVHDVAPGAELWFGYFGFNTSSGTALDFNAAVDCLAANVDIVIDDIGFVNGGPYDGTSLISQNTNDELNRATNRIRGYYTAVGNGATGHYQESFALSGDVITAGASTWQIHRWQATASTTKGGAALACIGTPSFSCGDTVVLQPGGVLTAYLQWNDAFGASANDYDLFLLDETDGSLYLASGAEQNGDDNPAEAFGWLNSTASTQTLDIMIGRFAGATRQFDMFVFCSGCTPIAGNRHTFNTLSSSVSNQADAGGGVMSTGAINASDPGNDLIEPYSSRGPTNDGRTKPEAVAIDGVVVSGAGGFPSPFYGTSTTSAHAGAIAALVLSCKPSLLAGEGGDSPAADRTALRNALTSSATDLGAAGNDNTYGAGRLNANVAGTAAGCTTDGDADGTLNAADNCPTIANSTQLNTDAAPLVTPGTASDKSIAMSDRQGDACDSDDDNDGIADSAEASGCNGSGPLSQANADTDGDRSRDGAECVLGSNPGDPNSKPPAIAVDDADRDGLSAQLESTLGSNPAALDSDGDGVADGVEYRGYSSSPAALDSDGDGCNDDQEIASVNGGSTVDVLDLYLVALGASNPDRAAHDINKDGNINVLDLLLVAQNATLVQC